jgi:uncharacterized protein with GYD domain
MSIISQEHHMHFCLTGQYTPSALNKIMENPKTNRYEAAKNLVEAAGGKLISMYSTAANGPGVLVIFDVPDPSAAPAISGDRGRIRSHSKRNSQPSLDPGRNHAGSS